MRINKYFCVILLLMIQTIQCQDITGKWLELKDSYSNTVPSISILDFTKNDMITYDFDKPVLSQSYSIEDNFIKVNDEIWGKISFINEDRINASVKGEINGKNTIYNITYVRLKPSVINSTEDEIENQSYNFKWNKEEKNIVFDKEITKTDSEEILLESIDSLYFISIYRNGIRENVIPIESADLNEILLYGMPNKPYRIIALANKT